MAANATELYIEMLAAIDRGNSMRLVTDDFSPAKRESREARSGQLFSLENTLHSVVACYPTDLRWAIANVLHFFARTEQAEVLMRYNAQAHRFLTDGQFRGAYGAYAMPAVIAVLGRMLSSMSTRRAVVYMGDAAEEHTINVPRCWTALQFLVQNGKLDMLCFQRSLSLGVMPYDCALLCAVHLYACDALGMTPGALRWSIGSLHYLLPKPEAHSSGPRNLALHFPYELLNDSAKCMQFLEFPANFPEYSDLSQVLCSENEVRV